MPQTLFHFVLSLEESVTYQAIIRKGEAKAKVEEARRMLLLFGREQLGEPPQKVQAALDALADVQRLEELAMRLRHVSSWHELLGMEEVVAMEESVIYQAVMRKGEAKGKAEEARRMLLLFGREQLGEPPQDVQAALDALADVQRFEQLAMRLKTVSSWQTNSSA